jgi:hypothetical protein
VRSRILKVRSAILKLWSTILEPIFYPFCFNLCLKLRTAILDRNYLRLEHKFIFLKRLLIGIKRFWHSFVLDISQHSEKRISSNKKRRTPLEKRLEKKNSRTGREIEDLLDVFFLLFFSHVVLLFEHESLCNLWHDLWLDIFLGV